MGTFINRVGALVLIPCLLQDVALASMRTTLVYSHERSRCFTSQAFALRPEAIPNSVHRRVILWVGAWWSGHSAPLPLARRLFVSITDMNALGIRMKPKNAEKPNILYQVLPKESIYLWATLPQGDPSDSISVPHSFFPIYKRNEDKPNSLPKPKSDEFLVVYHLSENHRKEKGNRYWADDRILYNGKSYTLSELREVVQELIDKKMGGLVFPRAPAKRTYAYFSPTISEWRTLEESRGHKVISPKDPGVSWKHLQPESVDLFSGVIYRVALAKQKDGRPLPSEAIYSAPAEIFVGDYDKRDGRWVSFQEFQKIRREESAKPPQFDNLFARFIGGFKSPDGKPLGVKRWQFPHGARVGDWDEWWKLKHRRLVKHAGIDFIYFFDNWLDLLLNNPKEIEVGTIIPSFDHGKVIQIFKESKVTDRKDFIGKTVIVQHGHIQNERGEMLCTMYVHGEPVVGLGQVLEAGQPVVTVADPEHYRQKNTPAHFDFTTFWLHPDIPPETLDWSMTNPSYRHLHLIDSLEGLNPMKVLPRKDPSVRRWVGHAWLAAAIALIGVSMAKFALLAKGLPVSHSLSMAISRNSLASIPVGLLLWREMRRASGSDNAHPKDRFNWTRRVNLPVPWSADFKSFSIITILIGLAFLHQVISTTLLIFGYHGVSINLATIITNSSTFLVFLMSIFWFHRHASLREPQTIMRWLGAVLGFVGASMASIMSGGEHTFHLTPALLFVFGATFTWAMTQMMHKILSGQIHPLQISFVTFFGSVPFLLVAKTLAAPEAPWFVFAEVGWVPMMIVATFIALGNVCLLEGSRRLQDAGVQALWISQSTLVVILAGSFLGEPLQGLVFAPIVLSSSGLLLLIKGGVRRPDAEPMASLEVQTSLTRMSRYGLIHPLADESLWSRILQGGRQKNQIVGAVLRPVMNDRPELRELKYLRLGANNVFPAKSWYQVLQTQIGKTIYDVSIGSLDISFLDGSTISPDNLKQISDAWLHQALMNEDNGLLSPSKTDGTLSHSILFMGSIANLDGTYEATCTRVGGAIPQSSSYQLPLGYRLVVENTPVRLNFFKFALVPERFAAQAREILKGPDMPKIIPVPNLPGQQDTPDFEATAKVLVHQELAMDDNVAWWGALENIGPLKSGPEHFIGMSDSGFQAAYYDTATSQEERDLATSLGAPVFELNDWEPLVIALACSYSLPFIPAVLKGQILRRGIDVSFELVYRRHARPDGGGIPQGNIIVGNKKVPYQPEIHNPMVRRFTEWVGLYVIREFIEAFQSKKSLKQSMEAGRMGAIWGHNSWNRSDDNEFVGMAMGVGELSKIQSEQAKLRTQIAAKIPIYGQRGESKDISPKATPGPWKPVWMERSEITSYKATQIMTRTQHYFRFNEIPGSRKALLKGLSGADIEDQMDMDISPYKIIVQTANGFAMHLHTMGGAGNGLLYLFDASALLNGTLRIVEVLIERGASDGFVRVVSTTDKRWLLKQARSYISENGSEILKAIKYARTYGAEQVLVEKISRRAEALGIYSMTEIGDIGADLDRYIRPSQRFNRKRVTINAEARAA